MTKITVGVVDVYVIRLRERDFRVLALQRSALTRCPGAWETVHGRIEARERPEHAAIREVREETALEVDRLYNVTCQSFYLHATGVVQVAVVFAAFAREPAVVTLGPEHERYEWLDAPAAAERFVWPREREAVDHITALLGGGGAGPVEDVLRVL